MAARKTEKALIINAANRQDGKISNWEVDDLILGRLYSDGSFSRLIRLYTDETNTFQIEFLKGSNLAYTFLPECTDLLNIMKDGLTGITFGMIAAELINKDGWKEVNS